MARIWDTYVDVSYQPQEIYQLRDECLRAKATTRNTVANRGLDKLLQACDEAIKAHSGLYFAAD